MRVDYFIHTVNFLYKLSAHFTTFDVMSHTFINHNEHALPNQLLLHVSTHVLLYFHTFCFDMRTSVFNKSVWPR